MTIALNRTPRKAAAAARESMRPVSPAIPLSDELEEESDMEVLAPVPAPALAEKKVPTSSLKVGSRISILWPDSNQYYSSRIISYDDETKLTKVMYDEDNTVEEFTLTTRKFRLLQPVRAELKHNSLVGRRISFIRSTGGGSDEEIEDAVVLRRTNILSDGADSDEEYQIVHPATEYIEVINLSDIQYSVVGSSSQGTHGKEQPITTANNQSRDIGIELASGIPGVKDSEANAANAAASSQVEQATTRGVRNGKFPAAAGLTVPQRPAAPVPGTTTAQVPGNEFPDNNAVPPRKRKRPASAVGESKKKSILKVGGGGGGGSKSRKQKTMMRLKARGCGKSTFNAMESSDAASAIAAYLVNYEERLSSEFEKLTAVLIPGFKKGFLFGASFVNVKKEQRGMLIDTVLKLIAEQVEDMALVGLRLRLERLVETLAK